MKYVYGVSDEAELHRYRSFAEKHDQRLQAYLKYLEKTFQVTDLPGAIFWTSEEAATQLISDIPLPAYTNEFRTVFCPELESWRRIYLQQLDGADNAQVQRYYKTKLTENHVLQILGHEFVHHSELFIDEAYETARWFEEGMCEYISRSYMLTPEEFTEEAGINRLLVQHYEQIHGPQSLEGFCADTYTGSFQDIFFFYWKSFLSVNQIVEKFGGDLAEVFREYRQWFETAPSLPLSTWFHV